MMTISYSLILYIYYIISYISLSVLHVCTYYWTDLESITQYNHRSEVGNTAQMEFVQVLNSGNRIDDIFWIC
jgi:hypothetical protein